MVARIVNRFPYPYEDTAEIEFTNGLKFGVRGEIGETASLSFTQLRLTYAQALWVGGVTDDDFPEFTIPNPNKPFEVLFGGLNDKSGDTAWAGTTDEITRSILPVGRPLDPILMTRPADGAGDRLATYYISDELLPDDVASSHCRVTPVQLQAMTILPTGYFYSDAVTNGFTGFVFGSVYGLTGQALMVFFEIDGGDRVLRIVGPPDGFGVRSPNIQLPVGGDPDKWWQKGRENAFEIVWDPERETADLFVSSTELNDDLDLRMASVPWSDINSIQPGIIFGGEKYEDPVPRLTTFVGLDGNFTDDAVSLSYFGPAPLGKNAIFDGSPRIRFAHERYDSATVLMTPVDVPEALDVPWMRPASFRFPEFDPSYDPANEGPVSIDRETRELVLEKNEDTQHNMFFRTERALDSYLTSTFMIEFTGRGDDSVHGGYGIANMGLRAVFGDRYLNFQFLGQGAATRTVGLLNSAALPVALSSYESALLDWYVQHYYRIIFDKDLGTTTLYIDGEAEPSVEINNVDLPLASSISPAWPTHLLAMGHLDVLATAGKMLLRHLRYGMNGLHYEARAGGAPGGTWSLLGGGSGAESGGYLTVTDPAYTAIGEDYAAYTHAFDMSVPGATVDFRMQVTEWKAPDGSPNPDDAIVTAGVAVYNGTRWLHLLFVTHSVYGKFLVVPGLDLDQSLADARAQNPAGGNISAPVDWTEEHEYRIDWTAQGIRIYIDDMIAPVLGLPSTYELPIASFFTYGGTDAVFFGSLDPRRATTSIWRYFRAYRSDGFDFAVEPSGFSDEQLEKIWDSYEMVTIESEVL